MMSINYGVCPKEAAPHKGYSDFVQHTGPMISGQSNQTANMQSAHNSLKMFQTTNLSSAQFLRNSLRVAQVSRNLLMGLNYNESLELANLLIGLNYRESREMANLLISSTPTNGVSWLNSLILSKTCDAVSRYNLLIIPQTCNAVSRETKHEQYSGSEVPAKFLATCTPGIQWDGKHSFSVNQQVTCKEKGNAANVALWINSFLNHEENQYSSVLSDGRLSLSELDQPFGLMPRTINSRRANSFIQFAKLTPSRSASVSNCVFSSGLIRMWNGGDFPAPLGWLSLTVTSFSIDMCTPIDLSLFSLGVHTNMCVPKKTTPPNGITSTERGLTTNDKSSIEVAMLDHITPLTGRNSLTPNKFTWRFLALNRHDKKAKPCRLSVEAYTEQEARRELAPHFILSLAARLPLQGMGEISIPSTIEQTSTVLEVRHV